MFCNKCGSEIPSGSKFCSNCGAPVMDTIEAAVSAIFDAPAKSPEPEAEPEKTGFEDINWNVNEYPSTNAGGKTEDVDFNWGADPSEVKDRYTRSFTTQEVETVKMQLDEPAEQTLNIEDVIPGISKKAERIEIPTEAEIGTEQPKDLSAADKINNFYTFNRKNEEFQQLLNREYDKIKGGNPIEQELSMADKTAEEKFETRMPDPSMEAFLEREGVIKTYQPKPVETDVLRRIEAQDLAREEERREQEARQRALEEAKLEAEAEMRAAEEAKVRAEEKARIEIAEEARRREEEEAQLRRAEEERARAAEEARIAEEDTKRLEAEARIEAERVAQIKAEEEARIAAEEEHKKLEAEAEARAQIEAEKIRAQREARIAAEEEERLEAERERRRAEEMQMKAKLSQRQESLQMQADSAAAAEEARRVLAQTARMREEEVAKINAAIASIRGEDAITEQEPIPAVPASVIPEPVQLQADPVQQTPAQPQTEQVQPIQPAQPTLATESQPAFAAQQVAPQSTQAVPTAQPQVAPAQTAHQAQLSEMARARREFLAEFGIDTEAPEIQKKEPSQPTPATVEELLGEKPVTGRETMLSDSADNAATKVIDKTSVLSGMEATRKITKEELREVKTIAAADFEKPAPVFELKEEPASSVEDLLEQLGNAPAPVPTPTPVQPEDPAPVQEPPEEAQEILMETPVEEMPDNKEEVAVDLAELFAAQTEADVPTEVIQEESALSAEDAHAEAETPQADIFANTTVEEGFAKKEEPALQPMEVAKEGDKPGLDDTMVMVGTTTGSNDSKELFDSYGEEEAESLRREQEAAAETAVGTATGEPANSEEADKKSRKKKDKEEKKKNKEEKKKDKKKDKEQKGGAGRVVLKILLVILIIIFIAELAGIGIKFLAPNSVPAEFIDNQLNKVIQLITGNEMNYNIPGIGYKV